MIKKQNPTTSGQRSVEYEDRSLITRQKPHKKLTTVLKKKAGRDCFGRISVRHRGGGAKRKYRKVTFSNFPPGTKAKILAVEYDPNRTAFIAFVELENGDKHYIIAPAKLTVGRKISLSAEKSYKVGDRVLLKNIATGVPIHNIEIQPNSKAKMVRAAGTSATVLSKDSSYVYVKLPSLEVRKFKPECYASIGQVSNIEHNAVTIGKAGRKRHMGIRPTVRGKAMHPAAHPHGGGEGVNPIGLKYPKTPWGKNARGVKTRRINKPSNVFIIKSRKRKKR